MKLSDAQFGVLVALRDHGPIVAVEVQGPRGMDGKRKAKLECRHMNIATLNRMREDGLVEVWRAPLPRPMNAVGKLGNVRTQITIKATDTGLAALNI